MKNIIIYTTLIGLLTISCNKSKETGSVQNETPIMVMVGKAQSDANSVFTSSGKIAAVSSANLSTRVMGYVSKVHVDIGAEVKKGQLLLSINSTDLQAKNQQIKAGILAAETAFLNAEKDYNRYKSLFENNSASQKELDDISTQYKMAKARLEGGKQQQSEIQSQFSYTQIRAPFTGIVTQKFIKEGAMASPGIHLLAIEAPNQFEVNTLVSSEEIGQVKEGDEVKVLIKSLSESIKGKVRAVSSSSQQSGGQYMVKIQLDDVPKTIRSGMYTNIQFNQLKTQVNKTVILPKSALIIRGQLTGVYVVGEQNTALLRWLRLGKDFGDSVEILAGLNASETYITSAEGKLYNGALVQIKK